MSDEGLWGWGSSLVNLAQKIGGAVARTTSESLDTVYSTLDPQFESIKSKTTTAAESVLTTIDKTFDFASDVIGNAVFGPVVQESKEKQVKHKTWEDLEELEHEIMLKVTESPQYSNPQFQSLTLAYLPTIEDIEDPMNALKNAFFLMTCAETAESAVKSANSLLGSPGSQVVDVYCDTLWPLTEELLQHPGDIQHAEQMAKCIHILLNAFVWIAMKVCDDADASIDYLLDATKAYYAALKMCIIKSLSKYQRAQTQLCLLLSAKTKAIDR